MNAILQRVRDWLGAGLLVAALFFGIPLGSRLAEIHPDAAEAPAVFSSSRPASLELTGLRLVFAETSPDGHTRIFLADPADPSRPAALAEVDHQPEYPPHGALSPDGSRLALTLLPAGASTSTARTSGSEIWMMDIASGKLRRLVSQAGFFAAWAPDGLSLVYARLVPRDSSPDLRSPDGQIPYRTEYLQVDLQQGISRLLLADDTSYGTQPLGWPAGRGFLYARIGLDGAWDVAEAGRPSGQERVLAIPSGGQVRGISLVTDGSAVIVDHLEAGQVSMTMVSLTGAGAQLLASAPADSASIRQPLVPIFLPGGRVLVSHPATLDAPGRWSEPLSSAPQASLAVYPSAPAGSAFLPTATSPAGDWTVWLGIPDLQSAVYLQASGRPDLTRLPLSNAANSLSVYGFVQRP